MKPGSPPARSSRRRGSVTVSTARGPEAEPLHRDALERLLGPGGGDVEKILGERRGPGVARHGREPGDVALAARGGRAIPAPSSSGDDRKRDRRREATVNHSVRDTGSHLLLRPEFAVEHGRHPAVDGRHDPARQFTAEVGRVDALAVQLLDAEGAARRRVEQRELSRGPDGERRRRSPRAGRSRPGLLESTRATSRPADWPVSTTAACTTLSALSRPTMPKAASCHAHSLASIGCGAWSVATMSIMPSASAARRASTSSARRSGGLTLNRAS